MFKQTHYKAHNSTSKKKSRALLIALLLLAGGYVAYCLLRTLPAPMITINERAVHDRLVYKTSDIELSWPTGTSSAIGTLDQGVLAQNNLEQTPRPIASIAKLITALAILDKYPLEPNQPGPTLTLGPEDVKSYNDYFAQGGSLVEVANGEKITQYEALEAILLPSANNMADTLAVWAYGSLPEYQVGAQKVVDKLGLKDTTVGIDSSGLDPSTTSTPSDLIKLGQIVLDNPVLKQIVSQKTATIPVAGIIENTNKVIGVDGIVGIKTGTSNEAGGNLLFASETEIHGKEQTIIGIIMNDESTPMAMQHALPLLDSAKKQFKLAKALDSHQSVGSISATWLPEPINIYPEQDLSILAWPGQPPSFTTSSHSTPNAPSLLSQNESIIGPDVGKIDFTSGSNTLSTKLTTNYQLSNPGIMWRLTHPF